jgi:hypothetical protein
MPKQINNQHYKTLTSHERFVLLIETMARRDDTEANRLEATCPQFLYRAEDQAFRDRMHRAYMIASWVALGLEGPLAQIRLAKTLHEHAEAFSGPVSRLAQLAFLYGREYGKWEAGQIEAIEAPDPDALAKELENDSDLNDELGEAAQAGREVVARILAEIDRSVAKAHRKRMAPKWREFGAFCRDTLGLEPQVGMKAFGVMDREPEGMDAGAPAAPPGDPPHSWTRNWERRFS